MLRINDEAPNFTAETLKERSTSTNDRGRVGHPVLAPKDFTPVYDGTGYMAGLQPDFLAQLQDHRA